MSLPSADVGIGTKRGVFEGFESKDSGAVGLGP